MEILLLRPIQICTSERLSPSVASANLGLTRSVKGLKMLVTMSLETSLKKLVIQVAKVSMVGWVSAALASSGTPNSILVLHMFQMT